MSGGGGRAEIKEICIPELEAAIGTSPKQFWTAEEEAILQKYYELGVPVKKLAEYLERSSNSITSKAGLMGLVFASKVGARE